jgi:hypothetical protein
MTDSNNQKLLARRHFFKAAGLASVGGALFGSVALRTAKADFASTAPFDDPNAIFTAALIAEDLATTFYYNGLTGGVIQDSKLAGAGNSITSGANLNTNVNYLQAALTQEIAHANLLRSLLGISSAAGDPVQTFYIPAGSFDTLTPFLALLDTLESAFIGAYLAATRQFAFMAAQTQGRGAFYGNFDHSHTFSAAELEYYAQVTASIMGVECEHRALGRVIGAVRPANNLTYEQTDGITNVFTGSTSAVAALTPFLTPVTGPAYSLQTALKNQASVSLPSTGGLPAF